MKKLLSMIMAMVLVFSLVACGNKSKDIKTTPESVEESKGESKEESKEESKKESKEESKKESKANGAIEKVGLGFSVGLSGKDLAEGKGSAQQDAAVAAIAVDAEGKIVKAYVDVAQSKFAVNDDGTFAVPAENAEFKTKNELGADYGMKAVSEKNGIGKEFNEQAEAFAKYIIGKTPEEVAGIPTKQKDDKHPNVPDTPDLVSSVTIDIGAFQKAVANAAANLKDAKGGEKFGVSIATKLGHGTKAAEGDKGASVQFETTAAVTVLDAEGKIVATQIDTAQNTVAFGKDGKVALESKEGTSKKALGAAYGMKKASKIGKEWDEQVVGMEQWAVGKTEADISGLPVAEGKTTDADLLATMTMTVTGYQNAIANSIKNAK